MNKFVKIAACILSLCILFSITSALSGAQETTEKETVFLDEEELSRSRVIEPGDYAPVGDWYTQVELMYALVADRIKLIWPDIWAKYENEFIYTDNGQFADRKKNINALTAMISDAGKAQDNMTVCDFNSDNKLSVADARIVLRVAVKLQEIPDNLSLALMDMNVNDRVDVEDARAVLRGAIGLDPLSYLSPNIDLNEILAKYSYRIKTF